MDKDFTNMETGKLTKDNITKTKNMVEESTNGVMEEFTTVNGILVNNME